MFNKKQLKELRLKISGRIACEKIFNEYYVNIINPNVKQIILIELKDKPFTNKNKSTVFKQYDYANVIINIEIDFNHFKRLDSLNEICETLRVIAKESIDSLLLEKE